MRRIFLQAPKSARGGGGVESRGNAKVRWRTGRHGPWAVLLTVAALMAAGCGARLSKAQIAAATTGGATGSATKTLAGAADAGANGDATDQSGTGASGSGGGGGGSGGPSASPGAGGGGGVQGAGQGSAAPAGGNGGAVDVGATADTLTIGNVSTLTGPVPGLFKGASIGTQAFFAYQNSLGGVFGRKLRLITRDDNLDPGTNDARIKELIPQVFAFVGSFSVVDNGGADDLAKSGVADVGYSLSRQRGALENNFSPQPQPPGWRLGPMKHFAAQFGPAVIEHMAFYTLDVQSAKDIAAGERAAGESLGYKFPVGRIIEANESNFSGDVAQMEAQGIKGVMLAGDAGTMARMASAMKSQGFSVPFANWGANAYDPTFIAQANGAGEGVLLDQQLPLYAGEDSAAVPEVALFNKWMKQVAPNQKPDIFAAFSWASARLFVDTLTKAGPKAKRADLIAALKGVTNFDSNGMVAPAGPGNKTPPTCYIIITVKGGKFIRQDTPPTGWRCGDGDYYRLST